MKTAKGRCGGLSDAKEASEEIKRLCEEVKPKPSDSVKTGADVKTGGDNWVAVSYKTQVVAGTNYFVKIKVDEGKYIHARIFKPLPCANLKPELCSIQEGKTLEDAIEHF